MVDPFLPFVIGTMMAAGVLAAGIARSLDREERIKSTLARTPTTAVADAHEGQLVKIVGTVEKRQPPLTSPLTGRLCLYYCIIAEELHGRVWQPLLREEHGVEFYLRDGGGAALVRPTGAAPATTALLWDEKLQITAFLERDEQLERFLTERGQPTRGLLLHKTIRAREAVIVSGIELAVSGRAAWEADSDGSDGGYRDAARRLTLAVGDTPLLMSDAPVACGRR